MTTTPSPHVWSRLGSEEAVMGTHWMRYQENAKSLQEFAIHHPEDAEDQTYWYNLDLGSFGGSMFENYESDGTLPPLFQIEGDISPPERHLDESLAGLAVSPDLAVREKRHRSKDWSIGEKSALLSLKVEAFETVKGKDWDFISKNLRKRHQFERTSKNCENQWGTLLKAHRAIGQHEVSAGDPQRVRYWKMSEDERSQNKLPRVFTVEWYKAMDYILARQPKGKRLKTKTKIDSNSAQEFLEDGDDDDLANDPVGEGTLNPDDKQPHMTNRAGMLHSINRYGAEDPSVNRTQLIDEAVNTALQLLDSRKPSSPPTPEERELKKWLSLLIKQRVSEVVISSALQPLALAPKKPGATIDEDALFARLGPFIKDQVEKAVSSSLKPISSFLELLKQEDEKFEEDVQALAEKKRTTTREEKNLLKKRQRIGRHRTTRGAKQHVADLRKNNCYPSADRVITPALKGMNIGRDEDRLNNVPEAM